MSTYAGYAGASSQTSYGTNTWADEAECIGTIDGTPADVAVQDTVGNEGSYYLDATDYGFSVAGGETPTSIAVTVRARATSASAWGPRLACALLLPGGTTSAFTPWQTLTPDGTFYSYSFGSGTWGLSDSLLSSTVLSDSAFGIRLYATAIVLIPPTGLWASVGIDAVYVNITTVPSTPFVSATMSPDQTTDEHWPPQRRYAFTY